MALSSPNELWFGFLTPEDRVKLAFEISYIDRDIRKQKFRREHPEWCELEVMNEIIRYAFKIKSEPIPEWLEKRLQERVEEWRITQAIQDPAPTGQNGNSPG